MMAIAELRKQLNKFTFKKNQDPSDMFQEKNLSTWRMQFIKCADYDVASQAMKFP